MRFVLGVKPGDHKALFEWVEQLEAHPPADPARQGANSSAISPVPPLRPRRRSVALCPGGKGCDRLRYSSLGFPYSDSFRYSLVPLLAGLFVHVVQQL